MKMAAIQLTHNIAQQLYQQYEQERCEDWFRRLNTESFVMGKRVRVTPTELILTMRLASGHPGQPTLSLQCSYDDVLRRETTIQIIAVQNKNKVALSAHLNPIQPALGYHYRRGERSADGESIDLFYDWIGLN